MKTKFRSDEVRQALGCDGNFINHEVWLVGLSLSFCVGDMARGKIPENRVLFLITGTSCNSVEKFELVLNIYAQSYWSDCAELAQNIARRFWNEKRILQPALEGKYINIAEGPWLII